MRRKLFIALKKLVTDDTLINKSVGFRTLKTQGFPFARKKAALEKMKNEVRERHIKRAH